MKPYVGFGAFVVIALPVYFFAAHQREASQQQADAEMLSDLSAWPPSAQEIQKQLHDSSLSDAMRHQRFSELFTLRFRQHSPQMAVRVKFEALNRIKLMCPARMEPWYKDRVALAVWRESQGVFGRASDVDIFETFIGAKQIKVGELHTQFDQHPVAQIAYASPAKEPGEQSPAGRRWRPTHAIGGFPGAIGGFPGGPPLPRELDKRPGEQAATNRH